MSDLMPALVPTVSPTVCAPVDGTIVYNYLLPMGLLFLLVCGLSASVNASKFFYTIRYNRGVIIGLACQFILMPFLGFIAVMVFIGRGNTPVGMTLLVVTSSPGGGFSNWWCSLFNADLALSIAMTSTSTLLSMAFLPLNILLYVGFLYSDDVSLHWGKFLLSVGVTVTAVISGILVSTYAPRRRNVCNIVGQLAGVLLVVSSLTFGSSCAESLSGQSAQTYVGIALPCCIGIMLPLLLTHIMTKMGIRMQWPERTAVCVESAYQNIGIAQAFAMTVLEGEDSVRAIVVPLFYGLVEVIVIALFLVISWKANCTLAPASDPFWKVVTKNYQDNHRRTHNSSMDDITALGIVKGSVEQSLSSDEIIVPSTVGEFDTSTLRTQLLTQEVMGDP